jgi:hypothetical protein
VAHLITYVQASDQEVSVLALATLANILVYCDTLLLADTVVIEALGQGVPVLLEVPVCVAVVVADAVCVAADVEEAVWV